MDFPLKRALKMYDILRKAKGGVETALYRTNNGYVLENDYIRAGLFSPTEGISNGYDLTDNIKDLKNCKCEPTYSSRGLTAGDYKLKVDWFDDYERASGFEFEERDIDIHELKRVCKKLEKHMTNNERNRAVSYMQLIGNEAKAVHPYHFGITKTSLNVNMFILKEVAEVIVNQVEKDSGDGVVGIGKGYCMVAFDDITIIYENLKEDYFLRFDEVLAETGHRVRVDKKEMIKAIEGLKIPKKRAKNNPIELEFTSEDMVIKVCDYYEKHGDKIHEVKFSCSEEEKANIDHFTVHFNSVYLVDLLKELEGSIVDLDFVGEYNPVIGRGEESIEITLPVEVDPVEVDPEVTRRAEEEKTIGYVPIDVQDDDDLPF